MRTLHKGIAIEPSLAGIIRHMHAIDDYRGAFDRLQASWDTLALLGQLSGDATEMSGTRQAFEDLTGSLLNHLAMETRDKVVTDLRTKAQNAIDVLVRNLFERTADIGFLAADTDIREMLEEAEPTQAARAAIEARFRDYVAKYSVYSDIVLIDPTGSIRARLMPHPAETARHPLVDEALTSSGAYVEHYGPVDFVSEAQSLVYAWRVEDGARRPLGVLVLVFRLADEMAGIFRKLLPENDWTVLGCVTPAGEVIAGSCGIQLPTGLPLPAGALRGDDPILRIGGRQYLSVACRSAGYQGYGGPGWIGLGLLPLEAAFTQSESESGAAGLGEDLLAAVTGDSGLFSDELRDVSRQAAMIQRDLNRSVWNGSIRQAGSTAANAGFSKILLQEISNAGRKTQAVFDASIGDLHRTVLAAMLDKCRARAGFAIDVMDRNLYERANDCRWWALNASFARVLDAPSREGARLCGDILAKINALYTVYSNLILFDAQGVVVAVSQPDQVDLVGQRLDAEWVPRTLALPTGQHYAVSAFEPSPLYADAATLIYTAAVRVPGGGKALGGIAIVFDSTPQFSAILADTLPPDEAGARLPGAFALLVASDGHIISSTDDRFPVGSPSPVAIDPASLAASGDLACIRELDGRHVAIGAALSKGYREYKTSDGHHADVVALCAVPLGDVAAAMQTRRGAGNAALAPTLGKHAEGTATFEIATFHIGRHWLGVKAQDVVEAVDIADLKPSARQAGDGLLAGYKLHEGVPVPVLRLARLLGIADAPAEEQQIVIVRAAGRTLGLVIDALGPIPEIASSELQPLRDLTAKVNVPALGIVAGRDARGAPAGMLMLLDVDRLGARADSEADFIRAAE